MSKITRRGFFKRIFTSFFVAIIASGVGYYYARYVEPKQMNKVKHTIVHKSIPKSFDGIKIAQFSDTHVGHFFDKQDLENAVKIINQEQPDVVFFTGDLMDNPMEYDQSYNLIHILEKVNAPLGKFAIYGNHDHGGYGTETYEEIMEASGFTILKNENTYIELIDKSRIYIGGVDDLMLGRPDFRQTLRNIPEDAYTILLAHEPDVAEAISEEFHVNLQLSGHSHGGQIQLPFIGPLITPPLGTKFYEDFYYLNNLTLYVNKGLGTTRQPYRFLVPPEITFFTLKSDQ
ncbi:metallophosphoesterase [Sutcliffiella rhizosphaerae]|uniref:UDP-2,3-diacylglucosamine pyrophosphatase LpxG n=1 Tax=Sutcliffiella rhizosphaerae TaxID=2880967 RepID=A0ABM8YJ08_9BACI|nr:metallophosphoesterase [Sutcliffiella rhizosphaerae]CAG9619914.1 UDP-2,3-diacylglucosamine pyrophosphatase LpxG [Sutcliffiella rhizosphaerae]